MFNPLLLMVMIIHSCLLMQTVEGVNDRVLDQQSAGYHDAVTQHLMDLQNQQSTTTTNLLDEEMSIDESYQHQQEDQQLKYTGKFQEFHINFTSPNHPLSPLLNQFSEHEVSHLSHGTYSWVITLVSGFQSLPQQPGIGGDVPFLVDIRKQLTLQSASLAISKKCLNSLQLLLHDVLNQEPYTYKVLDSVGKVPSGILKGDYSWLGDYNECRSVHHMYTSNQPDTPTEFQGKYCLSGFITLKPDAIRKPFLGICVPQTCSEKEVKLAMDSVLSSLMPFTRSVMFCVDNLDMNASAYITIAIICVLLIFVAAGTAYDYVICISKGKASDQRQLPDAPKQKEGFTHKILLSFSCLINGKNLLKATSGGRVDFLSSLNGMRVLSLWWVICLHSVQFQVPFYKAAVYPDLTKRFTFQVINQGTLSVDTFFFMSGLLVCYLTLKQLHKGDGKINWIMFYVHRFWRLTPVYAFLLVFYMGFMMLMYDGPWSRVGEHAPAVTSCFEYWWANLLYLNNFIPGGMADQCMGHTWYLANDMQFFVISPIFIYLLYRWKRVGIAFTCAALLATLVLTGVMARIYDQTPITSQSNYTADQAKFSEYIYVQPQYRIAPYLVGILLGYVFYKTNGSYKMPWFAVVIGWSLSTIFGMLSIYGFHPYYRDDKALPLWVAAWYESCGKLVFSMVTGWVVFACGHGYGGPVNVFLSWNAWLPLAKMNYAAYLIHPMVIVAYYVQYKTPMYYTDMNQAYIFMGHLIISYCGSFAVGIVLESPMMSIEKVIFKRWK